MREAGPTPPVFIVGGAGSGADTLLESLALASGAWHVPAGAGSFLDAVGEAEPADAVRAALAAAVVDREGRAPGDLDGPGVPVAAGERLAHSVPRLVEAFPGARFVLMTGAERTRADVEALGPDRWCAADRARLLEDPRAELKRICAFAGLPYDQALLTPFEHARRASGAAAPTAISAVAFGSASTASFPQRLGALGSSLLISTYQTNKLVCARERDGALNTHFRDFEKPMGMALAGDRLCLGTRTEVWDLRDLPEVAAKLDPPGSHDACYLPRNRHVTGDIAVHEMAFAQGELWLVATAFSCLATLDASHSFVPRWKPPFISALAPGDRCHLNGLAVVDDEVRYVTALGTTDEPGTWRARKADGGVLLDVPSSEIVVPGLSMPHSPCWHAGRLWVLESGKGELCQVDLESGRTETVVELPGFTRGLAFAGNTAFVGLSQIRESSTFGDLPITQRLQERMSGVWMVDLARGAIEGFLRFDDLVQEVFDVTLLPGKRWPEVADPGSTAVASSYVLP
jgi:uncharacterized protein (TIGR03032 family)